MLNESPGRQELIQRGAEPISVTISSPWPAELTRYKGLLESADLDGLIARYPVRYSGALEAIAKALLCQTAAQYERAALVAVDGNAAVRDVLREKLGALAAKLV
jgi:hypothetical protein